MTTQDSEGTASPLAVLGDKVLMVGIGLSAVASVVLGLQFVESGLAIGVTVALLIVAGLAYATSHGTTLSRYELTFVLVSFVALHIQLARGMLEFHFGVFVVLAILLVYLDWKVIAFGAVLFAVTPHWFRPLSGGRAGLLLHHPTRLCADLAARVVCSDSGWRRNFIGGQNVPLRPRGL